jgi:transposase
LTIGVNFVLMIDLEKASREELLQLNAQLLAQLQVLQERVKQLEAELASSRGGSGSSPSPPIWVKPNRPSRKKKKRKPRSQGFARKLDTVTAHIQHRLEACPDCHVALTGHRVLKTRQVIELPPVQAQVIEHQLVQRTCPQCRKSWAPDVDFAAFAVGRQRFGISLQAEVALLREQCRLPFRVIRDYLKHRFGLRVSVGQLVALVQGVAERGKAAVAELKQQIRGSPVVNGDETTWRENGQNGYVWSFSTDRLRYFVYRKSRASSVVSEVLGDRYEGVVVSDFYGGYNAHLGMHQRCWVHLLRDIHELKEKHKKDQSLRRWAAKVKAIYEQAKGYIGPGWKLTAVEQRAERVRRQREFEQELLKVCRPHLKKQRVQSRLCERIERFLPELFVFVCDPRVPADNNAAERSVREVVVSRKISGGTRSASGSETKSILASLFGTWRLQGRDLYQCCLSLLTAQNPTL